MLEGPLLFNVFGTSTGTPDMRPDSDAKKTTKVVDEPQESDSSEYASSFRNTADAMSVEERRKKRRQKQAETSSTEDHVVADSGTHEVDHRVTELLSRDEDELLKFVAKINRIYQEKLKKPAPFITFVLCGMQSCGKSTIMERFLNAVINIVQEGTGTRCPLDVTCIHESSLAEPVCELSGEELGPEKEGVTLSVSEVFETITEHSRKLASEDRFSTHPLFLVYRSRHVQNMRFVDTPGIISNKSTGKDNREDIKRILLSEMGKPNSRLCVLLEPKEFSTNAIIDFCDESLGGREKWIGSATFLMTKFDKQLEDSRSGSKANSFFKEFQANKIIPHLVMTPTLVREDLPGPKLYMARKDLLASAEQYEYTKFQSWCQGHRTYHRQLEDEMLDPNLAKKVGFPSAKLAMREVMLTDTAKRLPEVLATLRKELAKGRTALKILQERERLCDPKELKQVVGEMFIHIERRILAYLQGDLESALKFPERLQTLEQEIEAEEESDWTTKELNYYSEKEDYWRDRIAEMQGRYPEEVQANNQFLGGKQYQRAIEFFRAVMVEAMPNPYQLKDKIANLTGYLNDGLHRENWEHAMVEITRVCMKDISHPGINYLVKHVGSIFRRLFTLALDDIKQGERFSSTYKLIPKTVEKFLVHEFETMLWDLMKQAAEKTHCSLEPMYSTIDPHLPTFHPHRQVDRNSYVDDDDDDDEVIDIKYYRKTPDGRFEPVMHPREKPMNGFMSRFTNGHSSNNLTRVNSQSSDAGSEAKQVLKEECKERAMTKKSFLTDERTSMITNDEIETILDMSFRYMVALMDFNLICLKFNLNHYLYQGFKNELNQSFVLKLNHAEWDNLIQPDPSLKKYKQMVLGQIKSIEDSLHDVEEMHRKL